MDSSITAAGRALRAGDPLGALKRVALRDDPAALALRGSARLRVEMGRLRRGRTGSCGERRRRARSGGFTLLTQGPVRLLAPPIESPDAAVLSLLADGEAWSTSALALALGSSQRTVQRALQSLQEAGQVRALGRGRSRRWLSAPVAGFATTLLLPVADAVG